VREDFGADVAAQVRPQADLFLTGLDGVFEMVDGHVHGLFPRVVMARLHQTGHANGPSVFSCCS